MLEQMIFIWQLTFLGDDTDIHKFSSVDNRKIFVKVSNLMKKHNDCFNFAERIRQFIAEILFVHFISAAFIICLSSIDLMLVSGKFFHQFVHFLQTNTLIHTHTYLTQAPGLKKLIFVNYIIAATCQVFVYALAGSQLEDACFEICSAAYTLPWYKMDGKNRLLLKMMIMRAQKPALINVPFVTASLPAFSSVRHN